MLAKRIIPCLDVNHGRVVKGTNFVNLKDAGDPVAVAARYDLEGADELVFLDITASHEGRAILSHGCTKEDVVPPAEIDRAVVNKTRFMQNPSRHTYEE